VEPGDAWGYVRAALPAPPARVLEVGAGEGHLAAALREQGYEVVAIDPAASDAGVEPVALHDLRQPPESFDAAVAVLSLHHVEPLDESFRHLAELVRPGGRLVVDEFDVDRFDERAARWWMDHADPARVDERVAPEEMVADLRGHLHSVARVREALSSHFAVGEPLRGAYLHRWHMDGTQRDAEEGLIAAGRLPPTGARFVATRR
jgi:SAM-dependent methyltransferase